MSIPALIRRSCTTRWNLMGVSCTGDDSHKDSRGGGGCPVRCVGNCSDDSSDGHLLAGPSERPATVRRSDSARRARCPVLVFGGHHDPGTGCAAPRRPPSPRPDRPTPELGWTAMTVIDLYAQSMLFEECSCGWGTPATTPNDHPSRAFREHMFADHCRQVRIFLRYRDRFDTRIRW